MNSVGVGALASCSPTTASTRHYTRPLLLINNDAVENHAAAFNLLGSTWGAMNETGNYPGQAWLWLYTMLYQIPPYTTGWAANTDALAMFTITLLTVILLLVPWIPGLRGPQSRVFSRYPQSLDRCTVPITVAARSAVRTTQHIDSFWGRSPDVLCQEFSASPGGLTQAEAAQRLARFGPNEVSRRAQSQVVEIFRFLVNPLVVILLFAALVSGILGEYINAGLIALMVLISIMLNFWQAYCSQQAAEALRSMVVTEATVLRDGAWIEVPQREIVPGDVIRLSAGDLVPADARLLEAHDLYTNEAALTGESLPAEKAAQPKPGRHGLSEADAAVFLGTSVVSGTATALVVHTGRATEIGWIAQHLVTRPPETEFERGTRAFGLLITRVVVILVLFVFVVNAFVRHSPPLESFLFAIALAVGLTPEFLPMIISVTLAAGAMRMSRKKVIVKRLSSIENFGSMDVLCSDKTGTLTEGQITLERHVDALGKPEERVELFAVLNGAFETGIKSPMMGTSSNFGNMFSMAGASLFLPFLPMLPLQILINNFLYDLSQVTIPTDRVDNDYLQNPKRRNIGFIQRFMLLIGPISSIYDFLTFATLIWVFHSSETLFHTGWFVESLATQTLLILVIRTVGPPWKSRTSRPLLMSVCAAVATGVVLPLTPAAGVLGFTPLPAGFLLFLAAATASYLVLVETMKRRFYRQVARSARA